MPVATQGFAVSSPVLFLKEGQRTITLKLSLSDSIAANSAGTKLGGALSAYLTGEKTWLGPSAITAIATGTLLTLRIAIDAADADKAVVGYNAPKSTAVLSRPTRRFCSYCSTLAQGSPTPTWPE